MKVKEVINLYLEGKKVRRKTWPEDVYVYLTDKKITHIPDKLESDYDNGFKEEQEFLSPLKDIDINGLEQDPLKTWEIYKTKEEIVEENTPYIVKIKRELDEIDSRNISQIEKDSLYIFKACDAVSFDSIYHDWITFNVEEAESKNTDYPLYISVKNEKGSPWRPVKQHEEWEEDITYYNGGFVLELNKETKELKGHYSDSKLLYEEITREEYIKFYRDMAEIGVIRELNSYD